MRTSSIVFTGRDHPVASEVIINGDTTAARTRYTNVYRETDGKSFFAYRVPSSRKMTTYPFKIGDIDEFYDIDYTQAGTSSKAPTPHGDTIGQRLNHPSSETILPPGIALQIYDAAGYKPQGTVHCDTGHLRLEPGEEITITANKGKKEEPTVYHIEPSTSSTLQPGMIDFPCDSKASHSTRGGWTVK
jgi:hypothetical protein